MTTCKLAGATQGLTEAQADRAFMAALYGEAVPVQPANAPAKLGYIKLPGVLDLSFSKRNSLHKCPRYFHLREHKHMGNFQPNAHTAFGHAFGAGVQEFFLWLARGEEAGRPDAAEAAKKRAVAATLAWWDTYNIYDADTREIKTLWEAALAVEKFCMFDGAKLAEEYKLAYHPTTGKPLIELLYYIRIGDRYSDQGHIDLVLQNRVTDELVVFEVKTGSSEFSDADWANSAQTIGYNVVLQHFGAMSGEQTAFHVHYLCYNAKDRELQQFRFSRSLAERAEWLASLMLDVQLIESYEQSGVWPKRGSNCRQYKRNCEFYGTCDLTRLSAPSDASYAGLPLEAADFVCSIEELLGAVEQELEAPTMQAEVGFDQLLEG